MKFSVFLLVLLWMQMPLFAQEQAATAPSPKNAITFNLGGSGFIYSLGYERQTRQMGAFNIYTKVSAYCVPVAPLLLRYKQMGAAAEVGFKLGRYNHKLAFGLGLAGAYYYSADFKFSFPVADGSYKYRTMFAYICNISYHYYFRNSKWRFESGGSIILPNKEKYDIYEGNACGPDLQFERNLPIPWLTLGFAYTF